ncbi:MAG: hypothetical protein ACRDST_12925 [Pseudonocardiaceae bacterium]
MRVLVLGDSCSAGIGAPQAVYPSLLHTLLREEHRIENHAVPIFTSADAARYYRRVLARRRWDFVIVYLGNTEGSRSRYKGAYSSWRDTGRWLPNRRRRRLVVRIQPKDQIVFDDRDEQLSIATTPHDFHKNLESIAREARRRGTRVIMINPIANERFPAAMMGNNASFYKIVGLDACLADRLTGREASAQALIEAMRKHERGDLAAAVDGYRKLAVQQVPVSAMALNNLAVLLDQQKIEDEPIAILKRLSTEAGASGSVAAYNLSRILARRGQHEEARRYAMRAVEGDSNLYRVKTEYRQQITSLSSQANIDVIDLAELLTPADFVDYCHPTVEAHRTIAAAIVTRLTSVDGIEMREYDAAYVCVHPSPDAYFDVAPTLVDHFALDFDVARRDLRREAAALLDRTRELGPSDFLTGTPEWPVPETDLQANILNTFRYAAGHPVITSLDDIEQWLPEYGWEIGRFSEYYLCRILHDYAAAAESSGIDGVPDSVAACWQLGSTVQRQRVLPGLPADASSRLRIDTVYSRRVLENVRLQLSQNTALFKDTRATRIVTVRQWYLREAFRFGAHSRYGMLYPAWDLEKLVEGLCVCLAISRFQRDVEVEGFAVSLLEKMVRLREVHEKHAMYYVQSGFNSGYEEYSSELAALQRLFNDPVPNKIP